MEKMTSPSCSATTWRAEKERPSRSRSTSRMTGQVAAPRPQEVAVQRVGEAALLDRGRRRDRGTAPPPARRRASGAAEVGVAPAEEVAVDPLERRAATSGRWPARGPSPVRRRATHAPVPTPPTSRYGSRTTPASPQSCACAPCAGRRRSPRSPPTRRPAARPADRPARRARPRRRAPGSAPPPPRPACRPGDMHHSGDRQRHRGRAPRRQRAAPGRVVVEVPPHDVGVDVVVVEAPRQRRDVAGASLGVPSSASAGALVTTPSARIRVARHPRQRQRRLPRRGRRQRAQRAVAEHADAVVAVVPTLLHDRQAAAHRLPDADGHRARRPVPRPSIRVPAASFCRTSDSAA